MSDLQKWAISILSLAIILASISGCVRSETRTINARDMNTNLTHQRVQVWGTVVEIFPDNDNPKFGTFILKDQLGDTVRVRSTELPRFGQAMTVKGTVYEASGQFYVLQEKSSALPLELIVAGVAFLAFAILIITLLAVKPKSRQPAAIESAPLSAGLHSPEPRYGSHLEPTVDYPMHTTDYYGTIEVLEGEDKGKRFDISKDLITIGRDPSLDVVLSSSAISRKQAQIRVKSSGEMEIVNLGKSMYFQGQEVAAHKINNQDIVQFAGTHLKFHLMG